jgi:SAM-dependent methyltransferase
VQKKIEFVDSASVFSPSSFLEYSKKNLDMVRRICSEITPIIRSGDFNFFCTHCNALTSAIPSADWNLRNSVFCKTCGLSGRERHILDILKGLAIESAPMKSAACFESVTPFAEKLKDFLPYCTFSEYVSPTFASGEAVPLAPFNVSVRHEDICNSSYTSHSLDLIVHRDVYEHIPSIDDALREAKRVLSPGGLMVFTMPLYDRSVTRIRCTINDGLITHHHPPNYHGNPLNAGGSLVWTDAGFDFFDVLRDNGFTANVSLGLDMAKGYFPDCNPHDAWHCWNLVFICQA